MQTKCTYSQFLHDKIKQNVILIQNLFFSGKKTKLKVWHVVNFDTESNALWKFYFEIRKFEKIFISQSDTLKSKILKNCYTEFVLENWYQSRSI